MADMAVEDVPPLIDAIEVQLASAQLAEAAATAHTLKGTLSTFESGSPVRELQALTDTARSGDAQAAVAIWSDTRFAIAALMQEISALSRGS